MGRETEPISNRYDRPPEVQDVEPFGEQAGEREPLSLEIRIERRPPFPLAVRVAIFVFGWVLVLIGVAGLVLPGVQGILTIVAGAALLSLDNELVYRGLRRLLARWPHVWHRVEHFREKAHDRIHGFFHRRR